MLDEDGKRCLEWLLGYSPPIMGGRTIREFIKEAASVEVSEDAAVLERYGLYARKAADGKKYVYLAATRKNWKTRAALKKMSSVSPDFSIPPNEGEGEDEK